MGALSGLAQTLGLTPEQLQQTGQAMMRMMMMGAVGGGMGGPGGAPGGGRGPPPGAVQTSLTPEERADVDRLVGMGLGSQSECLQMYLACEKDVNQAAAILMQNATGGQ